MNKKEMLVIIIVSLVLIIGGIFIFKKKEEIPQEKEIVVDLSYNFNNDIIRSTYKDSNYLISPYSIEIALNMLREGASGNTKKELDNLLGNRKINDLRSDDLYIANAIFVKNDYQKFVFNDYTNVLKNNYHAEILYDEFKTPDIINNWVNKNTHGMIPKILDNIDNNFVMGLANALYLDIEWQSKFECQNTNSEKFTTFDGKQIDVSMMHQVYQDGGYHYFKEGNLEGVILPYESDNNEFEFIALMPNDIKSYVEKFNFDEFNKTYANFKKASNNLRINLSLPRFTYEYSLDNFVDVLNALGIKDAFNPVNADFSKIMNKKDMNGNLYVDEAIHKTKIELNENGTKAAAVTYFGMKATGMLEENYKLIDINFNKPFIYMIREKNTGEILFFGMVFEPENYNGSTCKNS